MSAAAAAAAAIEASAKAAGMSVENFTALEAEIVALGRRLPSGFRQSDCEKDIINRVDRPFPVTIVQIAMTINFLLRKQRLSTFRQDAVVVWKLVADSESSKLASLSGAERVVYSAVEREGNRGIWIKDLRKRTNILGQGVLEKILKGLVARKIIKSEKSIAGKNKKVYMLAHLTPSLEVTGGTWYRGHEMDVAFIAAVRRSLHTIVVRHGPISALQATRLLRDSKLLNEELALSDVRTALSTLVMDGLLALTTPMAMAPRTRDAHFADLRERYGAANDPAALAAAAEIEAEVMAGAKGGVKRARTAGGAAGGDDDDGQEDEVEDDDDDDDEEEDEKIYTSVPTIGGLPPSVVKPATVTAPCVGCKLIEKCKPGASVEPASCVYLRQWLEDGF